MESSKSENNKEKKDDIAINPYLLENRQNHFLKEDDLMKIYTLKYLA
jgi:hemerythrin